MNNMLTTKYIMLQFLKKEYRIFKSFDAHYKYSKRKQK